MCYSTSLRKPIKKIEEKLYEPFKAEFEVSDEYKPYFHLNGFSYGNLQIIRMENSSTIVPASWGLIPHWAMNDPSGFRKKSNTLNARSESIFEKASFRDSANDKRCLILADGFYEPHHENGISIPYFCYQPTKDEPKGELFLFAGLYTEIDDGLYTATILTTEANDFFAEVHNKKKRMPLVLDENVYEDWFDEGLSDQAINELMATGFSNLEFKAHPVSRDLYKRGVDTNKPYIIEEVQKDTLF
ncbi:SOS response-associated peptidase [Psychroserpens sp. XS_ASV72]|uniref:SOS response-associated peptidase n=1 Tax=Psychroserpens sp. XS_ASV72 TaxID=3241293 RepID=UPI003510E392